MNGKFFIFLIGYIIYPFSFLIPRNKKKWAFGSFKNAFNDNSKYLFIYVSEHKPAIDAAWISASRDTVQQIRAYGLKAYHIGTPKGLLFALRAKYWFFNAYTTDIFFFASGGAIRVNLWHGVGLKKMMFNNSFFKQRLKTSFYHPENYQRPDFLLSSTTFQSVKFAETFRITLSQCLPIGYPRNTLLIAPEDVRRDFIRRYEPPKTESFITHIKQYRKTFIYMPTWRESQRNVFAGQIDLNVLHTLMKETDSLLLLKPHVNTVVDHSLVSQFENIMLLDSRVDTYAVLPYTDVLITDYSSILYDYILMEGKDVILYLYDMDDYVKERNFNYPFRENVVGKIVYNADELRQCLQSGNYKIDDVKRIA
ncbi:MAG: CDP-glycerol glycerophosphotransferase family protein, partial [Dysgonamonadaceae bacterium]|nr:CDP-glycerol glycerophosphotransferase family protein [Dysgonamonadaceae bacterium]